MNSSSLPLTLILLCAFAASAFQPAVGQTMQRTCDMPEGKAFDFWIGEWDLSWPGGQGGTPEGEQGRGTNVIARILDDCIIQENFQSSSGYQGMSVSSLKRQTGKWHQTWVDSQGGYLAFSGEFRDGEMELRTEAFRNPAGESQINRMLWTNIADDSLEWHWQRSLDDRETWDDLWVIQYVRR